jgi:hypothetical protein
MEARRGDGGRKGGWRREGGMEARRGDGVWGVETLKEFRVLPFMRDEELISLVDNCRRMC